MHEKRERYRRVIWQCNGKFRGKKKCATPHLDAETIQRMFLKTYNHMTGNRNGIIEDCEIMRTALCDCTKLDADIAKWQEEIEVVAGLVKNCMQKNASTAQSQDEYLKKYNSLNKRYEDAVGELEKLKAERTLRQQQDKSMSLFIWTLKKQPQVIEAWDDTIWTVMVEKGLVHRDGSITFVFYSGMEITV